MTDPLPGQDLETQLGVAYFRLRALVLEANALRSVPTMDSDAKYQSAYLVVQALGFQVDKELFSKSLKLDLAP